MYSYRFKVYPVEKCPLNATEFETAARRRNCTEKTRYLCAPDENLTSLIEFCTDQRRSLYAQSVFAVILIMFHKSFNFISRHWLYLIINRGNVIILIIIFLSLGI